MPANVTLNALLVHMSLQHILAQVSKFSLLWFCYVAMVACTSPCQTCITTATKCTSCVAGSSKQFLYNNDCLAACNDGTYASATNDECFGKKLC